MLSLLRVGFSPWLGNEDPASQATQPQKRDKERKKAPSEGRGRMKKWASEQERAWICHDSLLEKVSYEPENTRGSVCVHAKSLQLSPPLCDYTGYRPPGSSVRGISQTRTLEWVAMPSSRDLPNSGIEPASPVARALQADSLRLSHWGGPDGGLHVTIRVIQNVSRISFPFLQAVSTLNTGYVSSPYTWQFSNIWFYWPSFPF